MRCRKVLDVHRRIVMGNYLRRKDKLLGEKCKLTLQNELVNFNENR